ncbi:hypothetical protein HOO68_05990 [Candidatus Gracilibacteria bacterium]|nr:hypothetical protein [Candidatus Gracilibacteria bacterium]
MNINRKPGSINLGHAFIVSSTIDLFMGLSRHPGPLSPDPGPYTRVRTQARTKTSITEQNIATSISMLVNLLVQMRGEEYRRVYTSTDGGGWMMDDGSR